MTRRDLTVTMLPYDIQTIDLRTHTTERYLSLALPSCRFTPCPWLLLVGAGKWTHSVALRYQRQITRLAMLDLALSPNRGSRTNLGKRKVNSSPIGTGLSPVAYLVRARLGVQNTRDVLSSAAACHVDMCRLLQGSSRGKWTGCDKNVQQSE